MSVAESNRIEQSLPYSAEAEQSVLGAVLLSTNDVNAIDQVFDELGKKPDFFYKPAHRVIFRAISDMYENEVEVDPVTLGEYLENEDKLENAGGAAYIAELVNSVPSAAHVEHYANIVREKYVHRSLIETCENLIQHSYNEEKEPDELLDLAEQRILSVKETESEEGLERINELVTDTFHELEEADRSDATIKGIPTGFTKIDEMTSGLEGGELIIIAARPGMGKTSLALNIGHHVALNEDENVAVFSMEMTKQEMVMRLLSSVSRVSHEKLREGKLSDRDWEQVATASTRLNKAPIFLDDNPNLTVIDMRAEARRLQREHGLSLMIVDYLQLMQGSAKTESREQELAKISRNLKQLAMELEIPIIALTQLNREVERRGGDKRPQLSDLRGSGAIEQDADLVEFIYRQYEYTEKEEHKGIADIIIGKQRNGPTGTVQLTWVDEYMRFTNMESHREPPQEGNVV